MVWVNIPHNLCLENGHACCLLEYVVLTVTSNTRPHQALYKTQFQSWYSCPTWIIPKNLWDTSVWLPASSHPLFQNRWLLLFQGLSGWICQSCCGGDSRDSLGTTYLWTWSILPNIPVGLYSCKHLPNLYISKGCRPCRRPREEYTDTLSRASRILSDLYAQDSRIVCFALMKTLTRILEATPWIVIWQPDVPSESLEKDRFFCSSRCCHCQAPNCSSQPLATPLRQSKTPPNFVPKRRPKRTTKVPNVPSESLEKRSFLLLQPLLPLPSSKLQLSTLGHTLRHTKTPPNFAPKKRPKRTTKVPNVPSESLEKDAFFCSGHCCHCQAPNCSSQPLATPLRHTKTAPNFVPKRRPKRTAKVPNVPSESFEKDDFFCSGRCCHCQAPNCSSQPLATPLRHTKTPPNFVPKKRPKRTTKVPNVLSESIEKDAFFCSGRCCHCQAPNCSSQPLATPLRHTKTPPNFVPKRRPKCTAKVPNVPSESLEKDAFFCSGRCCHCQAPNCSFQPLATPPRHTKTPPNLVPKRRPSCCWLLLVVGCWLPLPSSELQLSTPGHTPSPHQNTT